MGDNPSGVSHKSTEVTQASSAPTSPSANTSDMLMDTRNAVSHTVQARVTRKGLDRFENALRGIIDVKEVCKQKLLDQDTNVKRTESESKETTRIIDQFGECIDGEMNNILHMHHSVIEVNNKLIDRQIENEKRIEEMESELKREREKWNKVLESVDVNEVEDVQERYDAIMSALINRNTLIADLKDHWGVPDVDDLFQKQIPMDDTERNLLIERAEEAEKKLRIMTAEAAKMEKAFNERIKCKNKILDDESKRRKSTLQYSNQEFLSARIQQANEKNPIREEHEDYNGSEDERRSKCRTGSITSRNSGSYRTSVSSKDNKGDSSDSVSDSESSSSSDSDKDDPPSISSNEQRKRKKKKKKRKEKSKKSNEKVENSREKRRRKKDDRNLLKKLPLPDKYDGNKEGWSVFAKGMKARFANNQDELVQLILRETLIGEAQKEYRSLPKDVEKQGWKKGLKWLKERLFGGSMYTHIDYEEKLRNQCVGTMRVVDICEEFTTWINKLYEGSHADKFREEAKKRQLIVLYKRTDQCRDLLKMMDEKATYEEMKLHLERNEYLKRSMIKWNEGTKLNTNQMNPNGGTSNQWRRNDHEDHDSTEIQERRLLYENTKCYGCNGWGHKMNQCPNRVNPSKPDMRMNRSEGIGDQKKFEKRSNDVRLDQKFHSHHNQWEAKDRPSPKKDPEKRVMSVRIHPPMYYEDEN